MSNLPYRSAQKLRRDNCLNEITSDAGLLAQTLSNLGISELTEGSYTTTATAAGTTTLTASSNLQQFFTGTTTQTVLLPVTSTLTLGRTFQVVNLSTGIVTVQSSGANTITTVYPGEKAVFTCILLTGTTGASWSAPNTSLKAGTATFAPLALKSGTSLTTPVAGAIEYDGVNTFITNTTTGGRGVVPAKHYFRLTSNGSTISATGNFFGATSNIPLTASGFYEIDIYCWFLNTTSGTVVWTFTNSAAPTSQNIIYESSPVAGIVAPPGTATMLSGQIVNDATATKALTATSAITDAVNMYTRFKIWLQNGTGTSLKIQATKSAGTITPLVGSYWTSVRLPAASTGAFAA
jgi:hypothetical protein